MRQASQLLFEGKAYTCEPGETVLDTLLRNRVNVPYHCRKQTCLTCLMRSLDAPPPRESQINLKETLTVQNYFLACACRPVRNMEIARLTESLSEEVGARVIALNRLNAQILEIGLECERPVDFRAGQSMILSNQDKFGKLFSIASPSSRRFSGRIEIHVQRRYSCCFSEWLHNHLRVGDSMQVFGPTGHMFYVPGDLQQAVVLAGWRASLGGLLGILQDLFETGHTGPVYLFHGVPDPADLYLVEEIREIEIHCRNFRYVACVARGPVPEGAMAGEVHEAVRRMLPNLNGWRLFLSGPRLFVDRLRRQAYLDGASIREIFYDIAAP